MKRHTTASPQKPKADELPATGFMRAKQIHQLFGIGLSTWWYWVREGRAPQGHRLSRRTTVWRVEDIKALLDSITTKPTAGEDSE